MLVLGLCFIAGGLRCGLGQLTSPGAGFFPLLTGSVMSLLSAALLMKSILNRDRAGQRENFWLRPASSRKVLFALACLVFYLIALDFLGYIVTTFIFILSLFRWISGKRWTTSLLAALILSVGSYLLFKTGLGVSLPPGMIKFQG
jgi:putative tricarboxylic transport membrane protein